MNFIKSARANDGTSYHLYAPENVWESTLFEHLLSVAMAAINESPTERPAEGKRRTGRYSLGRSADQQPRIELYADPEIFSFEVFLGLVPLSQDAGEQPAATYDPEATIILTDKEGRVSMIDMCRFAPPQLVLDPHMARLIWERSSKPLSFSVVTAFALPADRAKTTVPQKEPPKPRWDRHSRTLFLGSTCVKRFGRRAANQEALLNCFENDHWPTHIDDPLGRTSTLDPRERLREAVRALNENHRVQGVLKFEMDGTGEGVAYRLIGAEDLP